jgi:hypothetical protein
LGSAVGCAGVGNCPEFTAHGVTVAVSRPDTAVNDTFANCTQSVCYSAGNYDLRHPITSSAAGVTNDANRMPVVAFGDYHSASKRIRLAKFSGGVWSSYTLDSSTAQFKDVKLFGTTAFRLIWVTEDNARLRTKTVDAYTGAVYALYPDLPVPLQRSCGTLKSSDPATDADCHDPDTTFFVNWVENAPTTAVGTKTIRAIGGTFHYETRMNDGSGDWTTFTVVERG